MCSIWVTDGGNGLSLVLRLRVRQTLSWGYIFSSVAAALYTYWSVTDSSARLEPSANQTRSEGSWGNEQKLVELTGDDDDNFGWSVAIYGKTAVIGAYLHDDDVGDDTGSARIAKYYNNFWFPSYLLQASDRAASDGFGYSVSISATTVIVSAFNGDGAVADSGAAYVFKQTSGDDSSPVSVWKQTAKLIASDGALGDRFGYAASISGPYALVGATQDNNTAGSAYLFDIYAAQALSPAIPGLLLNGEE